MHTAQPDMLVLKSVKCLTSISMPFDSLIHERKKKNQKERQIGRGKGENDTRKDMHHVWAELVHNVGRVGCSIGPS